MLAGRGAERNAVVGLCSCVCGLFLLLLSAPTMMKWSRRLPVAASDLKMMEGGALLALLLLFAAVLLVSAPCLCRYR